MTGGRAPLDKGAGFERAVVAYLVANGFPRAARAYGAGRSDDVGDIDGVPGYTIQVRNTKRIDLAGTLDDADRQRVTAGSRYSAGIHKRRNRPVADAYVVMTLAQFVEVVR